MINGGNFLTWDFKYLLLPEYFKTNNFGSANAFEYSGTPYDIFVYPDLSSNSYYTTNELKILFRNRNINYNY